ncbi:MAG: MFS transporter [Armatimonadota bacterium]|nr:MFS transporter [Armatimonadota bacterium]
MGTFRALRHPAFRTYWTGMLVSLVGTWMQSTAQSYLVYELTGSALRTGMVVFAFSLPSLLFALPGGAVADRYDRRRLLLVAQSAFMVSAAVLAGLTFAGAVRFEHVVAFAFWNGVVMAVDNPTRQALVPALVDREDLANAVALNSAAFNASRVFGPAVAGLVYRAVGPAWCFAANAVSYLAVIVPMWRVRLPEAPGAVPEDAGILRQAADGVRYVRRHPPLQALLLLLAAVGTFGFAWMVVMPAFAVRVLRGGPAENGLLFAAVGVGATLGALAVASVREFRPGRAVVGLAAASGVGLVLFSATRTLWSACAAMAVAGFFLIAYMSTTNATIQSLVDDRYRGRVMSLYTLALIGSGPAGSLFAGWLADAAGVVASLAVNGALVVASAVAAWLAAPELAGQDRLAVGAKRVTGQVPADGD